MNCWSINRHKGLGRATADNVHYCENSNKQHIKRFHHKSWCCLDQNDNSENMEIIKSFLHRTLKKYYSTLNAMNHIFSYNKSYFLSICMSYFLAKNNNTKSFQSTVKSNHVCEVQNNEKTKNGNKQACINHGFLCNINRKITKIK